MRRFSIRGRAGSAVGDAVRQGDGVADRGVNFRGVDGGKAASFLIENREILEGVFDLNRSRVIVRR